VTRGRGGCASGDKGFFLLTAADRRWTAIRLDGKGSSDVIDLQDFAGHADPRTTLPSMRSRDHLSNETLVFVVQDPGIGIRSTCWSPSKPYAELGIRLRMPSPRFCGVRPRRPQLSGAGACDGCA
jgi:hypothetical protein